MIPAGTAELHGRPVGPFDRHALTLRNLADARDAEIEGSGVSNKGCDASIWNGCQDLVVITSGQRLEMPIRAGFLHSRRERHVALSQQGSNAACCAHALAILHQPIREVHGSPGMRLQERGEIESRLWAQMPL